MNTGGEKRRLRILVTGANGQLGREIRQLSANHELRFFFLSKQELDISNRTAVEICFSSNKPDYCINCAAYTAVDRAETEREKAFLINAEGVGTISKACLDSGTRLIHISTDYVFDGKSSQPYSEDEAVKPSTIYGESKARGERAILGSEVDAIIIRTSWLYSEFGNNFVKTMLRLMSERNEIRVVNDQWGSPTYAKDLGEVVLNIIANSNVVWKKGIFHFSNLGITNWYEFALAIKELAGMNCRVLPIPTVEYPTLAQRPPYSALDTKKIVEVFDAHLRPWKESLSECLNRLKAS